MKDLVNRNSHCGVLQRQGDDMKVKATLTLMEQTEAKALKNLRSIVKQGKNSRTFLQMKVYPLYIQAQMKRWMTENQSQGTQWKPLNPAYAAQKKKDWWGWIGNGTKMLIASGRLYKSVIGAGDGHYKMITDTEMIVGTDVPYARYVSDIRPIMQFDKKFIAKIKADWIDFMISGKGR